jgi:hypothetical protein
VEVVAPLAVLCCGRFGQGIAPVIALDKRSARWIWTGGSGILGWSSLEN